MEEFELRITMEITDHNGNTVLDAVVVEDLTSVHGEYTVPGWLYGDVETELDYLLEELADRYPSEEED